MTDVCVAKYEVLSLYLLGQAENNNRKPQPRSSASWPKYIPKT